MPVLQRLLVADLLAVGRPVQRYHCVPAQTPLATMRANTAATAFVARIPLTIMRADSAATACFAQLPLATVRAGKRDEIVTKPCAVKRASCVQNIRSTAASSRHSRSFANICIPCAPCAVFCFNFRWKPTLPILCHLRQLFHPMAREAVKQTRQ